MSTYTDYAGETPIHNPASIEQKIEETTNRIAKGVRVITNAELEARAKRRAADLAYAYAYKAADGPAHERRYTAEIAAMPEREAADIAEIAYKDAERFARALEKELFAWQSINSNVRAMWNAAGVGQR